MNALCQSLIYLLACAVNGITPDPERIAAVNPDALYRLAKFHSVRAAVCIALERAGVQNARFHQAYKKAVSKNVYFDIERTAIFQDFEHHGIWYLPLKGCVLKDLYPENGMREMSDNDVLFDAAYRKQVRDIMIAHDYTAEIFEKGNQDVYKKPPTLNFEMHVSLFPYNHVEPCSLYYQSVQNRLVKDVDNRFGYHFSDEDFYVFMTAHEYKHFSVSGTGIRSLLDCYVYCKAKGDSLDWDYISRQVEQLGFSDFEQERRRLAMKVFASETLPDLTVEETDLLMNYLTAGTYGTFEQRVKNGIRQKSKVGYILSSLFPSMDYMKALFGFVRKCPALYPVGAVCRIGNALLHRKGYLSRGLKAMRNLDDKRD